MNEARHIDVDTLNALVDGAVPESERPEIMRHLSGCNDCRTEFRELRAVARIGAALPQFMPARAVTLGPEHARASMNARLVQTLPIIRSLSIAAVFIFVLISAFAVINTHQGSASPSDQSPPSQQSRANLLAPAAAQKEAPVATQSTANRAVSATQAVAGKSQQAAKLPAGQHTGGTGERSLSGWWIASLIIGLGTASLLLAWFALDRGVMRRFGRLSRA